MKRLTRAETMEAYNFMLAHRDEFVGGTAEDAAMILTKLLKKEVTTKLAEELAGWASIQLAEKVAAEMLTIEQRLAALEEYVLSWEDVS